MNPEIRTILIDDEFLAREVMKKYLQEHPEIKIVAECSNGFEGIKAINEFHPDLVFLDIQMPKLNGFEMLEILDEKPAIIFTTAYDQYAIKAFEVNAVDYLLKPIALARLNEAVTKYLATRQLHDNYREDEKFRRLAESSQEKLERIVIKDASKIIILPIDSIICLEAQDDYVLIYSKEGKHLKKKTMKYYESRLPSETFIRVHRSYIVNISQVQQIELMEKDSYRAKLQNGKMIPISRAGYQNLKEILDK